MDDDYNPQQDMKILDMFDSMFADVINDIFDFMFAYVMNSIFG